ncbi:uncharacterized protein LOC121996963 [Zingiber officinale]|uniref:DUF3741 domain-containing protein n=1 Tax=Zingiber officinale TaxID=94328 RepID=A0A8J5KXT5_ZINOF|nr:uncharacterized protein LOC121996963 [Zingiber officinale]XP_042407083.1 uncharacterized protein LOC121996963 [Zingiber officinale]KAG6500379.1 hypothetical protein ZIOFF_040224 [Zingiber officinale]
MSLAIAERKQQQRRQPGGFVGVFFHLLDWNRRLARKNLFPRRKLLPPVRAAKASVTAKTFAADEKMPLAKLLLIDDENQGGFPSMKKLDDLGRGMQAPGLVARLMGLESMPVVAHERPRKATDSSCLCNREESGGVFYRIDQDLCVVESGGIRKQECRPQKLRKTGGGFLERQPIDGGHGKASLSGKKKTVLSSSSKNKLHKPPSPGKSSRLPSGRLMKAATRILEPGLQDRGPAKVAIAYKDSLIFGAEGGEVVATLKNSNEPLGDSVSESSMTDGRSDGKLRLQLGAGENLRPRIGSSSFDISNASCSHTDFKESSFISLAMHAEQPTDNEIFKPFQSKTVVQNIEEELSEKNEQSARKTKFDRSSNMFRRNQLRQNHATTVREKVAFGTSVCSSSQGGRDANKIRSGKGSAFVVRNASNGNRSKLAYEQNGYRRSFGTSPTKNMTQKRPTSTVCGEPAEIFRSTSTKQNVGINFSDRKGLEQNSFRSVSKRCIKSNSNCKSGNEFDFKSSDIVCFTFNSPVKHIRISPSNEVQKMNIRSTNGYFNNIGCDATLELDAHNSIVSNRIATLRGDESRNLLEENIKELTFMDHELLVGAAMSFPCLQDLGAAFISGQNEHKQISACSKKNAMSTSLGSSSFPTSQKQDNVKTRPSSILEMDSSQLSPISILEASFSNDSCSIGSLNASSVGKLQVGLVGNCNTPQSTDTDVDLLDSATSVNLRRSILDKIQHLSRITSSADDIPYEVGFSNFEFFEARRFISNAVLLFENFTSSDTGSFGISLESTLLDLLQGVCDALLVPTVDPRYRGVKETDRLRELLFDCMIECLDSKYSFSCKSGYMTYFKKPFLLNREKLMEELHKQITDWMDLAGKFLDDLVKNEMKSTTENWTVCKIEACEAGMELESNILQALVEEILIDFY